jgi:hypothetical protein
MVVDLELNVNRYSREPRFLFPGLRTLTPARHKSPMHLLNTIATLKSAWRQGSGQRRMPFPMPVSGGYASSASKSFRHSGISLAINAAFEVFTRAGPDDSLERLTERSVGLVTDRPSDVDELFVTLFE